MFSCINEKPGPLVAVMALAPAQAAPITAEMDAKYALGDALVLGDDGA